MTHNILQSIQILTCTYYSSILPVMAVVTAPGTSTAITQHALCPTAGHIVKPNRSCSQTKLSRNRYPNSCCITKLPAYNYSIPQVPNVVTNSAPFSVVVDLHTTLRRIGASNKSQVVLLLRCCCNEEGERVLSTTASAIQATSMVLRVKGMVRQTVHVIITFTAQP